MKKFAIAIWLVASASLTWAACSTSTYWYNGKMVMCTTCCDMYGNCNTTCF